MITIKDAFSTACENHCENKSLIEDLWKDVEKRYSKSGRHYHTLAHLENLHQKLRFFKSRFMHWDTVVFAIVYHDIVYNTVRSNNEEKSALYARRKLKLIGYPEGEIRQCESLILATKNHSVSNDLEINLFTDADLSILGAHRFVYVEYFKQIRAEYSYYPDFIYLPGRKKVLMHFLQMKQIFKTADFYDQYESAARENIEFELEKLQAKSYLN